MFLSDTTFLLSSFFIDPASGALSPSAHAMTMAEPAYRFLLIPQGWTIGTELAFYLVAPFIVLRPVRALVAIAIGGLALRWIGMAHGLTEEPFTYRFFPFELALFVVGVLAYRLRDAPILARLRPFGAALIVLVAASIIFYGEADFVPGPLRHVAFLVLLAASLPAIFAATRRSRHDGAIGQLSYPLYLCHMPHPPWILAGPSLALALGAASFWPCS